MEQCTNCGAQLHLAPAGAVTRCQYCGAERREPAAPAAPPPAAHVELAPELAPRAPRSIEDPKTSGGAVAGAVIGVIVLGLVIFAIFAPGNHASVSSNSSATATATATTPAKPKLTIANIATTPFSYDPIDAPGMIGSFDRFDPIVNLEWVRSIGRAWRADAVFYRLDIDRVARDGLIDVKNIPNAQAMYRFVSPKCASDKAASTAVVVSKVRCGLNILVMRQEGSAAPEVIADAVDGDASNPPELPSPACTLAKAFAAVDKAGKLPAKPVFNVWILGATNRARGTGPEWIIGDIQGASIARVDATSCVLR